MNLAETELTKMASHFSENELELFKKTVRPPLPARRAGTAAVAAREASGGNERMLPPAQPSEVTQTGGQKAGS